MQNIINKNILIIGNFGYVGTVLLETINNKYKKKYITYGVDTFWFQDLVDNKLFYKSMPDFFLRKDIRNFNLKDYKVKFDCIIFLAAISNDPMGKLYSKTTHEINFICCKKIAQQAKDLGVKKFIFASSCSIYGDSGSDFKKENDSLNPLTDYAISKVKSEEMLCKLSSNNFQVISLRFATAAGFSNRLRLDLVFNDFVAAATFNKRIELLSNGESFRPLIHVKDMAEAIIWSIDYKLANNNFLALNTGFDSWNFKVIDLAKKIGKILSNCKVVIKDQNNVDKRSYNIDFNFFKKVSNFSKSKIDFKKSVLELHTKLLENNLDLQNFRNSNKWIRLKNLEFLQSKKYLDKNLLWNYK
jgi:nucleoside-diphosphate-sugar epimerase